MAGASVPTMKALPVMVEAGVEVGVALVEQPTVSNAARAVDKSGKSDFLQNAFLDIGVAFLFLESV